MKIRTGHVSNSSSSSFALVVYNKTDSEKTMKDFFEETKEILDDTFENIIRQEALDMYEYFYEDYEIEDNKESFYRAFNSNLNSFCGSIRISPKKIDGMTYTYCSEEPDFCEFVLYNIEKQEGETDSFVWKTFID
jgi:hypothetical protein